MACGTCMSLVFILYRSVILSRNGHRLCLAFTSLPSRCATHEDHSRPPQPPAPDQIQPQPPRPQPYPYPYPSLYQVDYGGFYDLKKLTMKKLENVTYVSVMNPTAGAFFLKSHLTIADARADPDAFLERKGSSVSSAAGGGHTVSGLTTMQAFANAIYYNPFKTIFG